MLAPDNRTVALRLSRDDAETLCLLTAVGVKGSAVSAVTGRLGLATDLRGAVHDALVELERRGLLDVVDGVATPTDAGVEAICAVGRLGPRAR